MTWTLRAGSGISISTWTPQFHQLLYKKVPSAPVHKKRMDLIKVLSPLSPEFHQNHWFLCPNSVNNLLINQSGLIIHCTAFPFWHFHIHHEWGLLWTHPMSSDPWSISSLSSMTCQSENICHHRHYHHHNKSLSINTSITNMMIITRTTMAGQKYNKTMWVEPSIDCHRPETDWSSLLIIILATRTSSWQK